MSELTDTDRAVLDLEAQWFRYPAAKESVVLERFGLSATRYYAAVNRLIDDPAALAYAPLTVKRLRRLQDARRRARTART